MVTNTKAVTARNITVALSIIEVGLSAVYLLSSRATPLGMPTQPLGICWIINGGDELGIPEILWLLYPVLAFYSLVLIGLSRPKGLGIVLSCGLMLAIVLPALMPAYISVPHAGNTQLRVPISNPVFPPAIIVLLTVRSRFAGCGDGGRFQTRLEISLIAQCIVRIAFTILSLIVLTYLVFE